MRPTGLDRSRWDLPGDSPWVIGSEATSDIYLPGAALRHAIAQRVDSCIVVRDVSQGRPGITQDGTSVGTAFLTEAERVGIGRHSLVVVDGALVLETDPHEPVRPEPVQPVDPVIGRVIGQRYTVTHRLARGGMGTVYRATDQDGREVAVKVMHADLSDQVYRTMFMKEARMAASLDHPNLVKVVDSGLEHGVPYLVMEYFDGTDLGRRAPDTPLPPPVALDIVVQVLCGLRAVHDADIVHHDIKPGNILVSSDGLVKVTDFGISREVWQETLLDGLVGTGPYVAPEYYLRGTYGKPADLYSVGIVLYRMVTGHLPFPGNSRASIETDVPAPSSTDPSIPPEIDQMVAQLAARDPANRPADAKAAMDLVFDLRHQGADRGRADTTVIDPRPRLWRPLLVVRHLAGRWSARSAWRRRSTMVALALVVLAVVVLAVHDFLQLAFVGVIVALVVLLDPWSRGPGMNR